MSAILKEGVLRGKNSNAVSKEKLDKIMDTIIEQPGILDQEKVENKKDRILPELIKPKEDSNTEQYILSDGIVIEGENRENFDEIRNNLLKELKPSNQVELIIVDRIVSSVWRLKRCLKIESQIMEYATSCVLEYEQGFFRVRKRTEKELTYLKAQKMIENKSKLEELDQYETMLESQIYRALNELNKLRRREFKEERKALKRPKRS
jgi:hypothetical protein